MVQTRSQLRKSPKKTTVTTEEDPRRTLVLEWKKDPTINPKTGRTIKAHASVYNEFVQLARSLNITPPHSSGDDLREPMVVEKCPQTRYIIDKKPPKKRMDIQRAFAQTDVATQTYIKQMYQRLDICDAPLDFRTIGMNEEDFIPLLIRYQFLQYPEYVHEDNIALSLTPEKQLRIQCFQNVYRERSGSDPYNDEKEIAFDQRMKSVVRDRPELFFFHVMFPMRGTLWHQNMLIVIGGERLIRFEPYTADVNDSWTRKYDQILQSFAKQYGLTYDGMLFQQHQPPREMFQSIESKFGRCPLDLDGFCVPWSLLITEILLRRVAEKQRKAFSRKHSIENYILYFARNPVWAEGWFLRKIVIDYLYSRAHHMYQTEVSPDKKDAYRRVVSPWKTLSR